MPLEKCAGPDCVSHNIREMRHAGHSEAQSVAAAERVADEVKHGHPKGKVDSMTTPEHLRQHDESVMKHAHSSMGKMAGRS